GRQQEGLRLLAHVARVARIRLTRDRVDDVAVDGERRHLQNRVDSRRRRIRDQQHVALMDVLEAANARAVKADALAEEALGQLLDGNRKVLPGPNQVDELEVDDL